MSDDKQRIEDLIIEIKSRLNFGELVKYLLLDMNDNRSRTRRLLRGKSVRDGIEIIDSSGVWDHSEYMIDMRAMEGVEISKECSELWAWALKAAETQKFIGVEYKNDHGTPLDIEVREINSYMEHTKAFLATGLKNLIPKLKSISFIFTPIRCEIDTGKHHDYVVMTVIPSLYYDEDLVEEINGKHMLIGKIVPVTMSELSHIIKVPEDSISKLFRVRLETIYKCSEGLLVLNMAPDKDIGLFETLVDLNKLLIGDEEWFVFGYTAPHYSFDGEKRYEVIKCEKDSLAFKMFEMFSKATKKTAIVD